MRPCGNPQGGPPSANSRHAMARRCLRSFTAERIADIADYQGALVLAVGTELCLFSLRSPIKPWINHKSVQPTPQVEPLGNRSEKGRCIPLRCARTVPAATPACRSEPGGTRRSSKVFKLNLLGCAEGAVVRRALFEPVGRVARSPARVGSPRAPFSKTTKSRCGPRSLDLGVRRPSAKNLKFPRNPALENPKFIREWRVGPPRRAWRFGRDKTERNMPSERNRLHDGGAGRPSPGRALSAAPGLSRNHEIVRNLWAGFFDRVTEARSNSSITKASSLSSPRLPIILGKRPPAAPSLDRRTAESRRPTADGSLGCASCGGAARLAAETGRYFLSAELRGEQRPLRAAMPCSMSPVKGRMAPRLSSSGTLASMRSINRSSSLRVTSYSSRAKSAPASPRRCLQASIQGSTPRNPSRTNWLSAVSIFCRMPASLTAPMYSTGGKRQEAMKTRAPVCRTARACAPTSEPALTLGNCRKRRITPAPEPRPGARAKPTNLS